MDSAEIAIKQTRLNQFLDRHQLDGAMLWHRNNFAWITGGCDNHVVNATPVGFAAILAMREKRVCLTTTIEGPRFRDEELVGRGIETIEFPWWDRSAAQSMVRDLIGKNRIATDADELGLGLKPLPADFAELRWSLTEPEIGRYRELGRLAAGAMEKACRELKPGVSEFEVAGILDHHMRAIGSKPTVTLIAGDERIRKFRHAIPTAHKIQKHVMLVACPEIGGLIGNLTRFVHFGPIPPEMKATQQSICDIDAAVILATKIGRTLGDIFTDLQAAYAAEKQNDQWKLHHQGGSTGYAVRKALGMPGSTVTVVENQAFAWNPSIVGAKSEDTVLVTSKGIDVLTAHTDDWPTVVGKCSAGELRRADILALDRVAMKREIRHIPVLLDAVLDAIAPSPGNITVDCTLGLGGHSSEILRRIQPGGKLIAIDFDAGNITIAREKLERIGGEFEIIQNNFAALPTVIQQAGIEKADAILADLGVASPQIDDPARGFSYRRPGPLDMRMDATADSPASAILARISERDLAAALLELGDETDGAEDRTTDRRETSGAADHNNGAAD